VTNIEGGDVRSFRHMFLYFCYPNSFERICSRNNKRQIYAAFAHKLDLNCDAYKTDPSPCGLDKPIFEIRKVLQAENTTDELDFYRAPLHAQWRSSDEPSSKNKKITKISASALTPLTGSGMRVWIEKTIVKGRPDRQVGPHRLGEALCSPQKSADGKDIYANMREVAPGDIVLQLTDNFGFTGASIVAKEADDSFDGIPGTQWGDQIGYRVQLRDFQTLDPPLSREALFSERQDLLAILDSGDGHGMFYNRNLELNQGAYLTPAPSSLVTILNRAYENATGKSLPFDIASLANRIPEAQNSERVVRGAWFGTRRSHPRYSTLQMVPGISVRGSKKESERNWNWKFRTRSFVARRSAFLRRSSRLLMKSVETRGPCAKGNADFGSLRAAFSPVQSRHSKFGSA
jgi:hypothetical protein